MKKRKQYENLWKELNKDKSLILIAGARQTGKTTFSKQIMNLFSNTEYFNYDFILNKKKIIENPLFFQKINLKDNTKPLIIFDELHKFVNWKNYIKGIYDEFHDDYNFIITGSGKLNITHKGQDSLAGRYFYMNLFPFTMSEICSKKKFLFYKKNFWLPEIIVNQKSHDKIWENLSECSGFPEPFIKGKKDFYLKWTEVYSKQIIREEISSFSSVRNLNIIELLYSLLPIKVGNPLSVNSVSRDLQVSFDTIKKWLLLFENVYLIFSISPWSKKISRAIIKEKKIYLYNYGIIENKSKKFENIIAIELLRLIYFLNNSGSGNFSLNYIRNKDKLEVDFIICENRIPIILIEAKYNDISVSKNLLYYQNILKIPAIQLVNKKNTYQKTRNGNYQVFVVTASNYFSSF